MFIFSESKKFGINSDGIICLRIEIEDEESLYKLIVSVVWGEKTKDIPFEEFTNLYDAERRMDELNEILNGGDDYEVY